MTILSTCLVSIVPKCPFLNFRQDELVSLVAAIVRENPILVDGSKFVVDNLVAAVKSHPVIVKDILARQSQLLEIIIKQHPEVIQQLRSIVSDILEKQPDLAKLLAGALEGGQKLVEEL